MRSTIAVDGFRKLTAMSRATVSQFAGVRDLVKYVPRRALLYVPGSNQKMLDKVPNIKVRKLLLKIKNILI